MSGDNPFLVVALSGRALASSAGKAGIKVIVLDLFDDLDTRALALASQFVAARGDGFDHDSLLEAADRYCPAERCRGLVYGSGCEASEDMLGALSVSRPLYGNVPGTVAFVKDPGRLYLRLEKLGIPFPPVSLDAPESKAGWLLKRRGASGGAHVLPAEDVVEARPDHYYQRRLDGRVFSVLFVADGAGMRIIGFNEQWVAPECGAGKFVYGGAVSRPEMRPRLQQQVAEAVRELVRSVGLRGLNGIDFIAGEDEFHVLEVNPRPTATIDLWDAEFDQGLFAMHVRACQGGLPEVSAGRGPSCAHAIVYARRDTVIHPRMDWPAWCTDLPAPGRIVRSGQPVCTIHARGSDAAAAKREVALKRELLEGTLYGAPQAHVQSSPVRGVNGFVAA